MSNPGNAITASREDAFRLRRMRPGDLPQVLAIENVSFPTTWSRALFLQEIRANPRHSYPLVLEHEQRSGEVLAYMVYWHVADEIHLLTIAVHPLQRRQGHGRRLIAALVCHARSLLASNIYLEVRRSNLGAQALYNAFGFMPVGVRRGYYSDNAEDALVMRLMPLPEDDPSLSA